MKRKYKIVTTLALGLLLTTGCSTQTTNKVEKEKTNEVELKVGTSEYTTNDVDEWILKYYRNSGLTEMKRSVALQELAKENNLDYEKAVNDYIINTYGSSSSFEANAIAQGQTVDKAELAIRDTIIYNMLIDYYIETIEVTDEEILAEYEANKTHYTSYDVKQTSIMDTTEAVKEKPKDENGNELEVEIPKEVTDYYNLPIDQKIIEAQNVIDNGVESEYITVFSNRYLGSSVFYQEHPNLSVGEYLIEEPDANGVVNIYKVVALNDTLESAKTDVVRTITYTKSNEMIQQGIQRLLENE